MLWTPVAAAGMVQPGFSNVSQVSVIRPLGSTQTNPADLGVGITEHHITHLATRQIVVSDILGAIGILFR